LDKIVVLNLALSSNDILSFIFIAFFKYEKLIYFSEKMKESKGGILEPKTYYFK